MCVCVCLSEHTPSLPVPPQGPLSLTWSLPSSICCPSHCIPPGNTGWAPGGAQAPHGRGSPTVAMCPRAVPTLCARLSDVAQASPHSGASLGGTANPTPVPRGWGSGHPPALPLPCLPAAGDEVRQAGGTGLLYLHNNLVNGAWPAGELGWRRHPLPAPLPPSLRPRSSVQLGTGRAAGRAPPDRPDSRAGAACRHLPARR